jgi:hypothetical protein
LRGTAGTLLSLYDGSAYLFYQRPVAGVIVVTNGQQTDNGQFSSRSGTRYSFAPNAAASPVQVQIDFSRSPNVSGTVAASDQGATPMTFSAAPEPSLGQGSGLGAIAAEYSGRMSSLQGSRKRSSRATDCWRAARRRVAGFAAAFHLIVVSMPTGHPSRSTLRLVHCRTPRSRGTRCSWKAVC